MKIRTASLLPLTITAVAPVVTPAFAQGNFPVIAETATGRVEGSVDEGVLSFKGIPFGKPPVGDLRWRAPQPVTPWTDVRPAKAFGPDCMQRVTGTQKLKLVGQPSEDCLYLNIWRPAAQTKKLPVIVWIYGGSFVNGGSSSYRYSGVAFARQDVISVSFNYRIGRLGFFSFPALSREHPEEAKGNYAYMDQVAALKWVKANIEKFGGDPDNITIFGQSAGGRSVLTMLTSPASEGLFNKAIIQSGGGRGPLAVRRRLDVDLPGLPSGETIGLNFARSKGIDGDGSDALAQLRALSAADVTDDLNDLPSPLGTATYSSAIIDGRIMIETPDQTIAAGRQHKVPVMIGVTDGDIGAPAQIAGGKDAPPDADVPYTKEAIFAEYGKDADRARRAYDPGGTLDAETVRKNVGRDRSLTAFARLTARAFGTSTTPSYIFRFSYIPDANKAEWTDGAPHGADVPFVFATQDAAYGERTTDTDRAVGRATNAYWANFAKTGNPNGAGLPKWPHHTIGNDQILDFQTDGKIASKRDPLGSRLDVTSDYLLARIKQMNAGK